MNIKKINLHLLHEYNDLDDLTFIWPTGSILYRVCSIPKKFTGRKFQEIIELLNKYSVHKKNDIYYFRFRDTEQLLHISEIFDCIGVDMIVVSEADKYGRDSCGFPIPEYLN